MQRLKKDEEKSMITAEFAKALKILQQDHLQLDEPIYSNAKANTLCNILEAVFLHGLKAKVTKKFTSYLMGQGHDDRASPTYWSFVKRFTHRGVVTQLTHLGQITSEIGLCRSWIRVALNDGIMESYLDSMLADTSSLSSYYEDWSFLRDLEQPGILKSYIQGLSQLQFKLSYNSSVLNMWTNAPLILSGLYEAHTPPPVMAPSVVTRPSPAVVSGPLPETSPAQETSPIQFRGKPRQTSLETGCDAAVYDFPGATPPTSNDAPRVESGMFTSESTALIKQMAALAGSSPDASTSSVVSCPDPPRSIRQSNDVVKDDFTLVSSQGSFTSATVSDGKSFVDSGSLSDKGGNPDNSPEKRHDCGERTGDVSATLQDGCDEKSDDNSRVSGNISSNVDSVKMDDSPNGGVNLDREKSHVNDGDDCDADETSTPVQNLSSGTFAALRDAADSKISGDGLQQSEKGVNTTQTPSVGESDFQSIYAEKKSRRTIDDGGASADETTKSRDASHDPPNFGNRLGTKAGWSSRFDRHDVDVVTRGGTVSDAVDQPKDRSYRSILETYEPSSGHQTTTTVQQLIQDLPETTKIPDVIATAQECYPDTPADFEFVTLFPSAEFAYANLNDYEVQLSLLGRICHEIGLDQQNFQCRECSRPIGLIYGNPRVCKYDGGYYCRDCHANDEIAIPSRVLYNWDFTKQKVSKQNKKFLLEVEEHPLLNIEKLNSKLYDHVKELKEIKTLRTQLLYLKSYMFTCQMTIAEDWRRMVWPKEYLYDSIHLYSISDLHQVTTGALAQNLRKIIRFGTKHVYECRLCSQKGFICELCHNPKVIYPFQTDSTYRCHRCKAVYHRTCKTDIRPCPKCQRVSARKTRLGGDTSSLNTSDFVMS